MKRTWVILLCLVMFFSMTCPATAEEPDESYAWSEPGCKYIVYALAPQKEIHDEGEAYAYAEELWPFLSSDPLPEGSRELCYDDHDKSYHIAINNNDDMALYNASFLSNGVIQQISRRDPDPNRFDGVRKDGAELDSETWEKVKSGIDGWVEQVSPGILELVEPLSVFSILENGDTKRLFISAMPLDPGDSGSISIIVILHPDGQWEITDYSCYGAG